MNEEKIKKLLEKGQLRPRQKSKLTAKSLIDAAEITGAGANKIKLDTETAPIVFEAVYKAIRQLGDAKWWLQGYEPRTHDVSMDILIEEGVVFQNIGRYKLLRHDESYRGHKITVEQAKEILAFWNEHCINLITKLKKETA